MIGADGTLPNSLLDELRWVHDLLRRDLQACQDLAESVAEGASPDLVRAEIQSLQRRGPLFQLQINCLRYCQFVHAHHGMEDVALFPAVRRADPELGPVVERLEADHRKVSDLLDGIEASSLRLDTADGMEERKRLVGRLRDLSLLLLEHLTFEEESLAPVLATWSRLPLAR